MTPRRPGRRIVGAAILGFPCVQEHSCFIERCAFRATKPVMGVRLNLNETKASSPEKMMDKQIDALAIVWDSWPIPTVLIPNP